MAESRLIRKSLIDSDRFNSLNWAQQAFFTRLLLTADDYGLFDARPMMLLSTLFPTRIDTMSQRDMQGFLRRCEEIGLVKLYSVNGKQYGAIVGYEQRARVKTKIPLPEGAQQEIKAGKGYIYFAPQQNAADCSKMQQIAADCSRLQQNAAGFHEENREENSKATENKQVAESCSKMQQNAADCSRLQQIAAKCCLDADADADADVNNNYHNACGGEIHLPPREARLVNAALDPDAPPPRYPSTVEEVREALIYHVEYNAIRDIEKDVSEKYLHSRQVIGWQIKGSYIVNWHKDLLGYLNKWMQNEKRQKHQDKKQGEIKYDFNVGN